MNHKTNKQYSFISKNRKFELHTSSDELRDLFTAWLMISIAFAIARSSELNINGAESFISAKFLILILISAVTVGLAFLLHELAHKIIAQRYKCWAEFRADTNMLVLALLMSFFGFIFIAPGAVIIFGNINIKQNGMISMAGPLTNIIIAIILLPLLFINISNPLLAEIVHSGYLINAWLGLFNMIPFGNFDGIKILRWNKAVYSFMVAGAAFLTFIFFVRM